MGLSILKSLIEDVLLREGTPIGRRGERVMFAKEPGLRRPVVSSGENMGESGGVKVSKRWDFIERSGWGVADVSWSGSIDSRVSIGSGCSMGESNGESSCTDASTADALASHSWRTFSA